MKINKEKCNAWCEMLMSFMALTKDLNEYEAKYIKGIVSIALGNLELQELDEKVNEDEKE